MLMFSATLNKNVAHLIDQYMKKPIFVDLTKGKTQKMPANIEHYVKLISLFNQKNNFTAGLN